MLTGGDQGAAGCLAPRPLADGSPARRRVAASARSAIARITSARSASERAAITFKLGLGPPPLDPADEILAVLGQGDPLDPAVVGVFPARDEAAPDQLVEQAAGRRERAAEIGGEIAHGAAALGVEQHQGRHLRDREVVVVHGADGVEEAVAQDGVAKRGQAARELLGLGSQTIHDTDDTTIVAWRKVTWVTVGGAVG